MQGCLKISLPAGGKVQASALQTPSCSSPIHRAWNQATTILLFKISWQKSSCSRPLYQPLTQHLQILSYSPPHQNKIEKSIHLHRAWNQATTTSRSKSFQPTSSVSTNPSPSTVLGTNILLGELPTTNHAWKQTPTFPSESNQQPLSGSTKSE